MKFLDWLRHAATDPSCDDAVYHLLQHIDTTPDWPRDASRLYVLLRRCDTIFLREYVKTTHRLWRQHKHHVKWDQRLQPLRAILSEGAK